MTVTHTELGDEYKEVDSPPRQVVYRSDVKEDEQGLIRMPRSAKP